MRRLDHADTLESLAREFDRDPLEIVEWFNERAAHRQFEGGFEREEAERLAVHDVRQELEGRYV